MPLAGLLSLFVPFVFSASPATSVPSPVLEILIESIGPRAAATLGPSPKVETAANLVPDPNRPAVLAALKDLEGQSSSTTTLREIMAASLILGQASQALSSADKLRAVAPGPESETTRAWALSQTGDFPAAFAAATELDQRYPGREDVRALLAYTRERVKPGGGGAGPASMSINMDISDGTVLAGPGRDPGEVRPEAMSLMKRAVAVRREGDSDGTLALAREALRTDPTAPVVRALEKLRTDAAKARNKAQPLGASDFVGGLLHYTSKSGKPRQIDFNELDASDVRVTDFPQIARELGNRSDTAQLNVESTMGWTAKKKQWLLLGRIRLQLLGKLTLGRDCSWAFDGRLMSYDDRYDFNKSNRDWLGETLTSIGRSIPGHNYIIAINGSRPIQASGRREGCP